MRGVNKRYKQNEVKKLLHNKQIKLAGLIETRVKYHKVDRILNNFTPGWGYLHNYQSASNGRIWIIWKKQSYTVTPVKEAHQLIHYLVKGIVKDMECYLTVIYGFNTIKQRKSLWNHLQDISQSTISPWIVCGDFNTMWGLQCIAISPG